MVIRKKVEIEQVIDKGGHVVADKDTDKKIWTNFTLRISKNMLRELDVAMENTVGISRTGWILQAIHEKLKRDQL